MPSFVISVAKCHIKTVYRLIFSAGMVLVECNPLHTPGVVLFYHRHSEHVLSRVV